MTEKTRILFLAASPKNTTALRLEEEIREIEEKIWNGTQREAFALIPVLAVRATDLQDALLKHRPHIVHFSGHGNSAGGIYLENQHGSRKVLSRKALTELFIILKREIRIVALNVCYSRDHAESITQLIDFAIGMNGAIDDASAIVFSAYFYQSLAHGGSVKEAFDLARNQLSMAGMRGAKIPELFTRNGIDAAKSYLIREQSEPTERPMERKREGGSGQRNVSVASIGGDGIIITGDSGSVNMSKRDK